MSNVIKLGITFDEVKAMKLIMKFRKAYPIYSQWQKQVDKAVKTILKHTKGK